MRILSVSNINGDMRHPAYLGKGGISSNAAQSLSILCLPHSILVFHHGEHQEGRKRMEQEAESLPQLQSHRLGRQSKTFRDGLPTSQGELCKDMELHAGVEPGYL